MIKLIIANKDYSDFANGLQSLKLSIAPDSETGFAAVDLSQTMSASGDLYDLLYDTFFKDPCAGKDKTLNGVVKIVKNECNFEFNVEILPDSVDVCFTSGCADFQIKRKSDDSTAFDCLKKQINFWKGNGFADYIIKQGRAYKVLYCIDMGIFSYVLYYIYSILFSLIVDIIEVICDIIDFFGKEPEFCKKIENLEESVLGCNRYHTAALIKDIFEYNAKLCGLELDSKLFQVDPVYSCTAIESAVENEGWIINDCMKPTTQFNENNQENWNVLQLAKRLQSMFNLYATVRKGKLTVDHKSRRYTELTYLLNVESEYDKGNITDCPTYSFDATKFCAYWKFNYVQDAIDLQGNKLLNEYNEIVEWNPGNIHNNNKGECRVDTDFAAQRYSNDSFLLESSEARFMTSIRSDQGFGAIRNLPDFTHAQIISNGQLGYSKLTIIDKKDSLTCKGCKFSIPVKKLIRSIQASNKILDVYDYNYPLKGQQLYYRFHAIDDPNGTEVRYMELQDITWKPSDFCKAITTIFENNLEVNIQSDIFGETNPEKIDIDFENCEITFSGMKYKCKK
ncbi:MAG TPA: hypothetical protein PK210_05040 [Bacteroidia bacterium]|nr:hypothetical protein [Bacteroidia bacterium]